MRACVLACMRVSAYAVLSRCHVRKSQRDCAWLVARASVWLCMCIGEHACTRVHMCALVAAEHDCRLIGRANRRPGSNSDSRRRRRAIKQRPQSRWPPHLRFDKAALKVGMDHARRLRRQRSAQQRPAAHLQDSVRRSKDSPAAALRRRASVQIGPAQPVRPRVPARVCAQRCTLRVRVHASCVRALEWRIATRPAPVRGWLARLFIAGSEVVDQVELLVPSSRACGSCVDKRR